MGKFRIAGLVATAILSGIFSYPLVGIATEIETNIDLNYTYSQDHLAEDIISKSAVQQKCKIKYNTTILSIFDLEGVVSLDLGKDYGSNTADSSKISPSLNLFLKSPQASLKTSYKSAISITSAFEDQAKSKTYSNSYLAELQISSDYWPEVRLKLERKRDFEFQTSEKVSKAVGLDLKKDIGNLRLEFNLKKAWDEEVLPGTSSGNDIDWTGKAAYQTDLWWGTGFEVAYEITEAYGENYRRGVFTGDDEMYTQKVKGRLKNSLTLTPRLSANVQYEYAFEQDLSKLGYDYQTSQKFGLDLGYSLLSWVKLKADFKRGFDDTVNLPPEEKEESLQDTIKLSLDASPAAWLKIASKAEWKFDSEIAADTGASLDEDVTETYETSVKNKFGNFWDLTVTGSSSFGHTDGWLTKEEGKLKAQLRLTLLKDLKVEPSYNISRTTDYKVRDLLSFDQKRTEDLKIKFSYKRSFTNLIQTSFTHEFGIKWEEKLDEVLSFEETAQLNENTKLSVAVKDLIRDMKLEGEVTRKVTDTRDDEEPMLVDLTYALKLDWKVRDLSLSTSYKYNDKGDTYDDMSFNTKLGWKWEVVDISGEYQFDKIFSDCIDESRKLNLKLGFKF